MHDVWQYLVDHQDEIEGWIWPTVWMAASHRVVHNQCRISD